MQFGKHKGCISGKDWIAVQNLLKSNEDKRYRKPIKNTALLTGVLRCSDCGSYMRPKIHTGRLNELGEERYSYVCELKEKSRKGKCQSKNIDGNKLDKLLIEKIKELIAPNNKICKELERISSAESKIVEQDEELNYLKQLYDKNQKDLESLIQRIKYVDIELIDDINKEVKEIKRKNQEIKNKMDILNKKKNNEDIEFSEKEIANIVLEIIEKHFTKFYDLDIIERRNLIKLLINKATGSGDNVEIDLLNTDNTSFFKTELLPAGEYSKRNLNVFESNQKSAEQKCI